MTRGLGTGISTAERDAGGKADAMTGDGCPFGTATAGAGASLAGASPLTDTGVRFKDAIITGVPSGLVLNGSAIGPLPPRQGAFASASTVGFNAAKSKAAESRRTISA